ncbi:MAG: energy transducer TonB [Bacteroidales bacterium]|nr:energy transducer TonB [Bacteroidales bacterium]
MPQQIQKSDVYASICTAVVCAIILLILLLCGLSIYKEEMEEGIMVSFSEDFDGGGAPSHNDDVDDISQETSVAAAMPQPAAPAPPIITQQQEPSAPVATSEKTLSKAEQDRLERQRVIAERRAEEERKAEEARKAAEAEAARKAAVAANASSKVTGAFGKGGTVANGSGQGSTTGNTVAGNPLGHGSSGGNSWSLDGRNLRGDLVKPSYTQNQEGTVVIEIKVDAAGNVVSASKLEKGTTITSTELINAAKTAAMKTKFSAGDGVSIGKITYKFVLN